MTATTTVIRVRIDKTKKAEATKIAKYLILRAVTFATIFVCPKTGNSLYFQYELIKLKFRSINLIVSCSLESVSFRCFAHRMLQIYLFVQKGIASGEASK